MPKEWVVPLKALASSAPGCSALTSWMCFSSGGLDLVKTTITVLGLHLSGKKCVFLPQITLKGRHLGLVLLPVENRVPFSLKSLVLMRFDGLDVPSCTVAVLWHCGTVLCQ